MQTTDFGGRGSSAYDLDRFGARPHRKKKKGPMVARSQFKEEMRARRRQRAMTILKMAAGVAMTLLVLVMMLSSRARMTELGLQISREQRQLRELQTENTRLTTVLDSKLSLRNLEEYATQKLGMVQADKSQITYVDLSDGDRIELTEKSPKRSVLDWLRVKLGESKEYKPES